MEFHHISVMLEETVKGLVTNKKGTYVDCTLGGAGHSRRIADMLEPAGRRIGIDQDEAAIAAANRMSPRSRPRTWAMLSCASRLRSSDHELAASGIGPPRQSAKAAASSTPSTATAPSTLHSSALR